jgi:acyl dehydratase
VSHLSIANLGWKEIRLLAPVFAGETIYAETEVLEKRLSKSRPNAGIVGVETTGKKADGTVFLDFQRTVLVPKQGHAVEDLIED